MSNPSSVYVTAVETALGWMALAWGPAGLVELTLPLPAREDALQRLRARRPVVLAAEPPDVADLAETLRCYFQGQPVAFDTPLDQRCLTPFQRRVYKLTRAIPWGETRTYGDLARAAGSPGAARAVGQCMARNPWPILVPCHRVVGSDGRLTGYGGGLDMKRWLLDMERRTASLPSTPDAPSVTSEAQGGDR
jgi:methylated-DNA-[protein]-cysteine S-methyltransferase